MTATMSSEVVSLENANNWKEAAELSLLNEKTDTYSNGHLSDSNCNTDKGSSPIKCNDKTSSLVSSKEDERRTCIDKIKRVRGYTDTCVDASELVDAWSEIKRPRDTSPGCTKSSQTNGFSPPSSYLEDKIQSPAEKRTNICDSYACPSPGSLSSDDEVFTPSTLDGDVSSGNEDVEDDQSVTSGLTTVSTSSYGSTGVSETLQGISLSEQVDGKTGVDEDSVTKVKPLWMSLFPNIPPSLNFAMPNEMCEQLPLEIRKHLKWKLSPITPIVVRKTLLRSNFRLTKKAIDWVGQWGNQMKSDCFKEIKETQKINHFPGTYQIGRKDRLWRNFVALQRKFGRKDFNYIPKTYILPQDLRVLRQRWEKFGTRARWIIKPPASARGTGIRVINKWTQLPKKRSLIVQKYIARPFLIDGSKFDIRLYVFVASFCPLRLYMFDDGLARFASVKYSYNPLTLDNRYMHLTNYSINKNSQSYTTNEDSYACQGHKWTLHSLMRFLAHEGINTDSLWHDLTDCVVKTIMSAEKGVINMQNANTSSLYSCFELFGVDVMLDERLKTWLLEVNISPSLHSASTLDQAVKSVLVRDLFNMVMHRLPSRVSAVAQEKIRKNLGLDEDSPVCLDQRLYAMQLTEEEKKKHALYEEKLNTRDAYIPGILEHLTGDDVRQLTRYEDELARSGRFLRLFPTKESHKYHHFFDSPRYYNMLLDAWEVTYVDDREKGHTILREACLKKIHLNAAPPKCHQKEQNESKTESSDLPVVNGIAEKSDNAASTTTTATSNSTSVSSGHGSSCSDPSSNNNNNNISQGNGHSLPEVAENRGRSETSDSGSGTVNGDDRPET